MTNQNSSCRSSTDLSQLQRRRVTSSSPSALTWLEKTAVFPKWYVQKPGQSAYAACGTLTSWNELPSIISPLAGQHSPRILGWRDFFSKKRKTTLWEDLPSAFFALPLYEFYEEDASLYINDPKIQPPKKVSRRFSSQSRILKRIDTPTFDGWEKQLNNSLQLIDEGLLHKIVHARHTEFHCDTPLSPYTLLKHLQIKSSNTTHIAYIHSEHLAFVAATPETLFARKGPYLRTHAVASTRPQGSTRDESTLLGKELLQGAKELLEFDIVAKAIEKVLHPYCTSFSADEERSLLQAGSLQHLTQNFTATLQDGISDLALIKALHPTPAVGGLPQDMTQKNLYEIESFDRGLYAAPFGFTDGVLSEWFVAIRSALVKRNTLSLFAGTGIVKGSTPQAEWNELEQKIAQYTSWLY